jgi:hypothetical protein
VAYSICAYPRYVLDKIKHFRSICNPLNILDSSSMYFLCPTTHNWPHARAASASSTSSALSTTAPHTARAALRTDALRNRVTVRNRGTCISAHMNSRAAAGGEAGASTGMGDGKSAGSSEARKSGGGEPVARRVREGGPLERVLQLGERPFSEGIRGGARAAPHRTVAIYAKL